MRILIGYDGSACADAAVDDLKRSGLPDGSEARAVCVAHIWTEPPGGYAGGDYEELYPLHPDYLRRLPAEAMEEAKALAETAAGKISRRFPTWKTEGLAVADSPQGSLVGTADQWPADLIVVGSHGRSALGRLVMGSVSQNVVTHARCSVRVGRASRGVQGGDSVAPPDPPVAPVRLVIGVDGSPDAARAVGAVAARVWPRESKALVVSVLDGYLSTLVASPLAVSGGWSEFPRGHGPPTARMAAERAADRLREVGLAAEAVVREGDPKRVLLDEATNFGADCIVVGAKGHGRLERLLLGSVSAAIAARAHCSVEVVR